MRNKGYLLLLLILTIAAELSAQPTWDRPMQVKSCSIQIRADVFTATTFIEIEFYNPNAREIEGLYQFELKPGQVITAFQLDLNGKFRDGSIEEKWKATNAYNTIVGKRIDPALLTMDRIDHYSLRIYPVPAKSSRRITMTIQQLLKTEKNDVHYMLPLSFADTVKKFNLSIDVQSAEAVPATRPGLISRLLFASVSYKYGLNWSASNIFIKEPIAFSIPLPRSNTLCLKKVDDQAHFALRLNPSYPTEYEVHPRELTILWDASASSSGRDIDREKNFLRQFIAYHDIHKLTIIPFNYKVLDTAVFNTTNNRWQNYLDNLSYNGATQLGCVDISKMESDMFIFFTDGNNTYGKAKPVTGTSLVYAVHASSAANTTGLSSIVGFNGGNVIDLTQTAISNSVRVNSKAVNWLLNIRSSSRKTIIEQSFPMKMSGNLFINGTTSQTDTLFIDYGNNNRVNRTEKIIIDPNAECSNSAVDRINMLTNYVSSSQHYNWNNVLEFGLREKVVTLNTAYIVLERVEDYIKFNIEPPKELEEECTRLNYVKRDTRPDRLKQEQYSEFYMFSNVVAIYNARLKQWDANQQPIAWSQDIMNKEMQAIQLARGNENEDKRVDMSAASATAQAPVLNDFREKGNSLQEVVVMATGYARQKRDITASISIIKGSDLRNAPVANLEQALQGRVPGLMVTPANGVVGSASTIRLRGMQSLSANSSPLFVLDGIPVSGNINDFITVNDIESITVLRDAQAAALYGSRAAGGAIVITSKKGKDYYRFDNKPYRLKDMEDVDYLQEIKGAELEEKKAVYERLRLTNATDPGFYFDMAQHFFECGFGKEAKEILMNAAEVSNGSYQVLRAMGYVFEDWKNFDEAIKIYQQLADDYTGNLFSYRDLAWAYYQDGQYQEAVNTLFNAIRMKNDATYYYYYAPAKATMMSDMNAIISMHKDQLDISAIPPSLIKPMQSDLRIVLDCNKGGLNNMIIKEPGGTICNYSQPVSKNGGAIHRSDSYQYYTSLVGPSEYIQKSARQGSYKVKINYYDYYSYPGRVPTFIRVMTFKNFGKEKQAISVENVIMDNQYGEVEIAEVKW